MKADVYLLLEDHIPLFKECIAIWGEAPQMMMIIEEMSELTKEVCKYFRGNKNQYEIMDETCDVLIMVMQLMVVMEFNNIDFCNHMNKKLQRIAERLNKAGDK